MVRLVSRARLVLGMGGVGHTDKVKHLKGRDFEVPMCGAAYLTSFNPELTDFFEVGSEILCYGSPQDCADVARWGLARPSRLVEIGAAARRRCIAEHTWDRRLEQMLLRLGRPAAGEGP
jgi:spore maturation protein CgeB